MAFLYIKNEQPKKEIKKIIPFIVASKRVKYLEINLTKEVRYFYTENCNRLIKEIKEDNRKISHVD